MKFGIHVKHTSPLKNYYWYFCCSINSNGFVCNKESSTVKLLKFQIIYWNISDKVNHLFWVRLHFNLWALMFGVVWRPPLRRPFFTCDFTSNYRQWWIPHTTNTQNVTSYYVLIIICMTISQMRNLQKSGCDITQRESLVSGQTPFHFMGIDVWCCMANTLDYSGRLE